MQTRPTTQTTRHKACLSLGTLLAVVCMILPRVGVAQDLNKVDVVQEVCRKATLDPPPKACGSMPSAAAYIEKRHKHALMLRQVELSSATPGVRIKPSDNGYKVELDPVVEVVKGRVRLEMAGPSAFTLKAPESTNLKNISVRAHVTLRSLTHPETTYCNKEGNVLTLRVDIAAVEVRDAGRTVSRYTTPHGVRLGERLGMTLESPNGARLVVEASAAENTSEELSKDDQAAMATMVESVLGACTIMALGKGGPDRGALVLETRYTNKFSSEIKVEATGHPAIGECATTMLDRLSAKVFMQPHVLRFTTYFKRR